MFDTIDVHRRRGGQNLPTLGEVSLLKVAALYGDKITLISPMYQLYDAITINDK